MNLNNLLTFWHRKASLLPGPRSVLFAAALVAAVVSPGAQVQAADATSDEFAGWLDQTVAEVLASAPAAGANVLVAVGDKILLARSYGFSDLENHLLSSQESVYQIGSLTKQFTAVALLQLEESGKLKLSDDITRYLPDYPTHGQLITIENLLYHTSGIPNYISAGEADSAIAPGRRVNQADWRMELLPREMLALFQDKPLEFVPGESWNYSNAGYYLAGLIIEKVSGMSYGTYLDQNLFKPAGMRKSYFTDYEQLIEGRARGYKVSAEGELLNADPISMTVPFSAGALSSTTGDLFRWNLALHRDRILLGSSAYHRLITPGKLNNGQTLPLNYALGIAAPVRGGFFSLIHPGGINGFSSVLSYFPEQQLSIAVLVNTYDKRSETIADQVEQLIAAAVLEAN